MTGAAIVNVVQPYFTGVYPGTVGNPRRKTLMTGWRSNPQFFVEVPLHQTLNKETIREN
jgi:hypothetical protein